MTQKHYKENPRSERGRRGMKHDLKNVLAEHDIYLKSNGQNGKRADLREAQLELCRLELCQLARSRLEQSRLAICDPV